MAHQNTSDLVESHVKKILENSETIEVRGIETADLPNCVPSQINCVISTRFTIQHGYLVESERGGDGYIRIARVRISDKRQLFEQVGQLSDDTISEKSAFATIRKLHEGQIITKEEGDLMLSAITKGILSFNEFEDHTCARVLRASLERSSCEDGKWDQTEELFTEGVQAVLEIVQEGAK